MAKVEQPDAVAKAIKANDELKAQVDGLQQLVAGIQAANSAKQAETPAGVAADAGSEKPAEQVEQAEQPAAEVPNQIPDAAVSAAIQVATEAIQKLSKKVEKLERKNHKLAKKNKKQKKQFGKLGNFFGHRGEIPNEMSTQEAAKIARGNQDESAEVSAAIARWKQLTLPGKGLVADAREKQEARALYRKYGREIRDQLGKELGFQGTLPLNVPSQTQDPNQRAASSDKVLYDQWMGFRATANDPKTSPAVAKEAKRAERKFYKANTAAIDRAVAAQNSASSASA